MAKNISSSDAFDMAPEPARRLSQARARREKGAYQLNCLIDKRLKEPLGLARLREGRSSGEIIEPLLAGYLKEHGYL